MNWADRLEKDVTAKERDTEALKQEHQRDTSRLKVSGLPVEHLIVLLRSVHTCLAGWQGARNPSGCNATSRPDCARHCQARVGISAGTQFCFYMRAHSPLSGRVLC